MFCFWPYLFRHLPHSNIGPEGGVSDPELLLLIPPDPPPVGDPQIQMPHTERELRPYVFLLCVEISRDQSPARVVGRVGAGVVRAWDHEVGQGEVGESIMGLIHPARTGTYAVCGSDRSETAFEGHPEEEACVCEVGLCEVDFRESVSCPGKISGWLK